MAASSIASDPVFFMLLSVVAVGGVVATMSRIMFSRPAIGMLFFFVFFSFAWRLVSVLYIDAFGPLFSEQLERAIGPGISAVPIAISQGFVIAAVLFSFRQQRLNDLSHQLRSGSGFTGFVSSGSLAPSGLAFWIISIFVAGLWIELLFRGHIPLFVGIERYDYAREYAGPLHLRLLEWGPMLAFQIGIFFAAPILHGRPLDRRFGGLLAILILYLFLVGHRFSSFYLYVSFFAMAVGATLLGRQVWARSDRGLIPRVVLKYLALCGAVLVVLIVAALAYSYIVVRGFEGNQLLTKLSQRIFVQQGEMWWMTYERVFLRGDWNSSFAFYKLFIDPFDPSRNSTMQFLMELGLPIERAHFILDQGSSYTGGWPEVLFELGGPIGGFALVALSAVLFSEFMFLLMRCVIQERYATCFFLTPILYAVSTNIVSGMINSFIQVTFLIKIAAVLIAYVTEERWRLSLSPYSQSTSLDPQLDIDRERNT